jgi:amidase
MTQLHDLTALEQGAAVRRGEVSPVELVTHYLERVARLSDEVGAFVTVTGDLALDRAREIEALVREGEGGPLLGVPTAVKDLNQTAGVRTTFGSAVFADFVPEVSDEVVRRMEAAGLVSLGKTNTPELGTPCYTEPEVAPPARTPWDLSRTAGGSSGGAGAAVASGLVPVAQGSDGGGSIRIPASCCGLVGVKPSRGRVSAGPVYGDVVGLGTSGPLARTVRDAAALLDVMAGPAVGDPWWAAPLPEDQTYLGWCDRPPGRLRVARFATPVITDVPVDAEVLAGYEAASRLLRELGHDVEEVPVPMPRDAVPVFETCWAVGTAAGVPPGREGEVRPLTRWLAERGRAVAAPDYALAVGELRRVAASGRCATTTTRSGTSRTRRRSRPGRRRGTSPACPRSRCRCTTRPPGSRSASCSRDARVRTTGCSPSRLRSRQRHRGGTAPRRAGDGGRRHRCARWSISRWIFSSSTSSDTKTSQAFMTTAMPQPTMGNTGQKNPPSLVTAQITTRNAFTSR